jgi:hypothetical protein
LYTAPAAACTRIYPEPFRIDPSLAAEDSEAPAPFQAVSALTYRIEAERCVNGVCTTSSCGDDGVLELRFAPPAEAAAGELGYKLVWLGGDMPEALRERIDKLLPLSAADEGVTIELGWNGITELNGELALVAVDHAGNESSQSEPVHVAWSDCTQYYDESLCREGAAVLNTPAGCSVSLSSRPTQQTESPLGAAALFGLVTGCALRARRRGARTG